MGWNNALLICNAFKYDNKLIGTLKNSLIICMHHLPQTIIMLIATVGLYISRAYISLHL